MPYVLGVGISFDAIKCVPILLRNETAEIKFYVATFGTYRLASIAPRHVGVSGRHL